MILYRKAEVYPKGIVGMKLSEFLYLRKESGMETERFKRCFACGGVLNVEMIPNLAKIEGFGNAFVCDKCAEEEDMMMPTRIIYEIENDTNDTYEVCHESN